MEPKTKIAVITPYHQEPEQMLWQCHKSVLNQQGDFTAHHFMIADGFPREQLKNWQCKHSTIHQSHNDNGNTPRAIGSLLAESENYDFITFLDADNWYHNGHLESLIQLQRKTKKPIITCFRTFHLPDGRTLQIQDHEEESLTHVDTSCILLHKKAFKLNYLWSAMPKQMSCICDRIFRSGILHHRYETASTKLRSVAFRTQYSSHYIQAGLLPPKHAKTPDNLAPSHRFMMSVDGVAACVNSMGFWPMAYL